MASPTVPIQSTAPGRGFLHMVARDLALVAIFAGIMAALGLLPRVNIPWSPVPITAQSLGVMLAGAIIGARRAAASMVLFLALVAVGLPLLAGGFGGLGVFAGASVGFLFGWIVAAFVIGFLTERVGAPYRLWTGVVINVLGGIVVLYICGIIGMLARTKLTLWGAVVANAPYLIGDAVKVVIAASVAQGVHRAYPGLLRNRHPEA